MSNAPRRIAAAPMSVIIAALALALTGCAVDLSSSEEEPTPNPADDDDSAAEDEPAVDPCLEHGGTLYWERYWRDQDGNGCLSWWEADEPDVDQWFDVAWCQDGTPSAIVPEGAPFLAQGDLCEEEDEEPDADDDDSASDEDPVDDDDVVADEDPASDDDDVVSDDDDSVVDAPLVQVTRAGFTGAWDIRVFNWDQLIGFWWGTSPEYCSYGIGDSLGCYIEIASGDRFSVNGVISAGGWLVTAAPADFISRISVNGVTYPVTESRSSSPAVGPWTDVSPGTCRYGAVGHNDLWCRGASSL